MFLLLPLRVMSLPSSFRIGSSPPSGSLLGYHPSLPGVPLSSVESEEELEMMKPGFFELDMRDQLLELLWPSARFTVGVLLSRGSLPSSISFFLENKRWEGLLLAASLGAQCLVLKNFNATLSDLFFGFYKENIKKVTGNLPGALGRAEAWRRRGDLDSRPEGLLFAKSRVCVLLAAALFPFLKYKLQELKRESPSCLQLTKRLLTVLSLCSFLCKALYSVNLSPFWSPTDHLLQLRTLRRVRGAQKEAPTGAKAVVFEALKLAVAKGLWLAASGLALAQWYYENEKSFKESFKAPPLPAKLKPLRTAENQRIVENLRTLGRAFSDQTWHTTNAEGESSLRENTLLANKHFSEGLVASSDESGPGNVGQEEDFSRVFSECVFLPLDPRACPLCRRPRREPTALPSGYVFCRACIEEFLEKHRCCPVTGLDLRETGGRRIHVDG